MSDRSGAQSVGSWARGYRVSIVVAALTVLLAWLPAFASTPETGIDPAVTLTVTPSDGLADGQTVTVTGTGFPPNTAGTIQECGGSVIAPQCDLTVTAAFVTTATGDIPPTDVTVKRIVDTGTTTFNCGAQACALVATAGGRTSQHHIRMAAAGTSIPGTSTPTSTPPTSTPPTSVPPTTIPPATIPPTTVPPTLPGTESLCTTLRGLLEPFPFLRPFVETVLNVLGCAATA